MSIHRLALLIALYLKLTSGQALNTLNLRSAKSATLSMDDDQVVQRLGEASKALRAVDNCGKMDFSCPVDLKSESVLSYGFLDPVIKTKSDFDNLLLLPANIFLMRSLESGSCTLDGPAALGCGAMGLGMMAVRHDSRASVYAHEIGHSVGASHRNPMASCAIMNKSLDGDERVLNKEECDFFISGEEKLAGQRGRYTLTRQARIMVVAQQDVFSFFQYLIRKYAFGEAQKISFDDFRAALQNSDNSKASIKDFDLVVLVGPTPPLLDSEVQSLANWLSGRRSLLIAGGALQKELSSIDPFTRPADQQALAGSANSEFTQRRIGEDTFFTRPKPKDIVINGDVTLQRLQPLGFSEKERAQERIQRTTRIHAKLESPKSDRSYRAIWSRVLGRGRILHSVFGNSIAYWETEGLADSWAGSLAWLLFLISN